MKQFSFFISAFLIISGVAISQVPQGVPYQAVARDGQGHPLDSQQVKLRFSILDSLTTGAAVYVESHDVVTNSLGLFAVNVGMGTPVTGVFNTINWGVNAKFLKVELDTTGAGNSYVELGTQQMMSVPYAFFSNDIPITVSVIGDTLKIGNSKIIIPGVSAANANSVPQQGMMHTCGADSVHNPGLTYGSVIDQDGNSYKTIVIGTQEWMAENLKVSHYRNGDPIPNVANDTLWSVVTTGAFCWYNNDSATYDCPFGKFYNWYAVTDSRNLCPTGWHTSTDAEWSDLVSYLGGAGWTYIKIKSAGNQYWIPLDTISDNSSGLSCLPGSYRGQDGTFSGGLGTVGYWWTTSESNPDGGWLYDLGSYGVLFRNEQPKRTGFSVRCVKD